MSVPTRAELREWSANLQPEVPLDVGDPKETRYVALAEAGRGAVDEMQATIELAMESTTQLLTGPSGSGKTTELYRLRRDLNAAGYSATVIDITRYISQSSSIDVTEFLLAIALGAHDALTPPGEVARRPSFLARLGGMLRRLNVDLEIGGVSAKVSSDGVEVGAAGATVGLNLAAEMKTSQPFVAQLRQKLSYHLAPLYDEVAAFLIELLPEEETAGSVLIVDGLEKLRGTTDDDLDVQRSIEALFVNHASKLRFASHHLVYTVPTYLQFTSPGALPYDARLFVPVPHVAPRPGHSDGRAVRNIEELREVVARRVPVDRIFDADGLAAVIAASGGHLRDLFRILQKLINLMLRLGLELPVTAGNVDEAITEVGRYFAPRTEEQAAFLRAVAAGDGTVRPMAGHVQLMARLVQGHMLLAHLNGEDWYEVHPLARRALGPP